MSDYNPQAEECRWIFAYGSLMWRPGFEFQKALPARLSGYHRRLSVYSNHYRGTTEKPGLVLGLDRGGSCAGLAYEIAEHDWQQVLTYVRKREMIGGVYREIVKRVFVQGQSEPVAAVTYVVRRGHEQCAPPQSIADTMAYIEQGWGQSGSCVEYVKNTLTHLRSMGIYDSGLEKLEPYLRQADA